MPEKKEFSAELLESLSTLPITPGVYEMRTEDDTTLYVGKAKNLKSRVKSYFLDSAQHSSRIQKLVEKVHHIEWTQTGSEVEALLLETNLIKQKNPKFNILMRDDKNFSYIKVTVQEDFPRIFLTRRVLKDGAKYFGPKTSSGSVRKTIDLLQDIFQFRSSTFEIKQISEISGKDDKKAEVEVSKSGSQRLPCLNFHLGKCDAPCVGKISKTEYRKKITASLDFLKGNYREILTQVKEKMMTLAKDGKFELAAKMRDKMLAIESISEKQIISAPDEFSADIIGTYQAFGHLFFHLFSLREGKIINSETFAVRLPKEKDEDQNTENSEQEAFESFLRSHPERVADSPKVVVVNEKFFPEISEKNSEKTLWEEFLSEKFGHKTEISLPQKAKRKKLLELAEQNAENYAKRHVASFLKHDENKDEILEILQKKLQMDTLPSRMECYDISHFSGQKTVASMVVFEDGKAKNADYRSFNIQTLKAGEIDDFASLEEAVSRRLKRLPEKTPENWKAKKLKTKKEFENILNAGEESIYQNFPEISSSFFYDKKNKVQKKIESSFYGLFEEKKSIISAFTQKNHLLKRAEISLLTCPLSLPKGEQEKQKTILSQKFLLTQLFQTMRCEEYSVHTQDTEIQKFLESKGFNETKEHIFSGKFHSPKNDSFQKIPNLLVIDGGKGQLSSVAKALMSSPYHDRIALCSIAKREEEIFLCDTQTGEIILTKIQKNSPEGHLLQEIRDEAHRFAIGKNRKGREKTSMKSVLDEIKGLGPKTKKMLKQKGGVPAIREMSDEELLEIVSEKVMIQLREKL